MVAYTQLNDADLDAIALEFGLSSVESVTPFERGSENSNFRLDTASESYVLTVCESKSAAEADTLVNTLLYLEQQDYMTTRIIPTKSGHARSELRGKPLLLKEYLHGVVLDPFPVDSLPALGASLGRLHTIVPPDFLPSEVSFGVQTFKAIREEYGEEHPFLNWLEKFEREIQVLLNRDLPVALIHGDVFADNVVHVKDHGPVIMDFEEAAVYYRVFDVGMAIVGACRRNKGQLYSVDCAARENMLAGYRSVIQLTPDEERALNGATAYAAAAMAAWRFRQFNIVRPELGKQEHYRELHSIALAALGESPADESVG